MPAERVSMRKVREILRLKAVAGMGHKGIARSLGIAASTVRMTLRRAAAAGLSWPLPDELTDAVLETKLYARAGTKQGHRRTVEPDWAMIHRELKRKHVTLSILWEEYIAQNPAGYRYSRFCDLYRSWEGSGSRGWPPRSVTKPAATTARSSISACPSSSAISRSPAGMAATLACCARLAASRC